MAYDIGPLDGSAKGARRLLALADHLDTVRDRDYDHRVWRRRGEDGGWVMCALGHAVSALPEVIGLRWRDAESLDVVRLDGSGVTENALCLAAEVFEIAPDEAAALFGAGLYTVAFYGPRGIFGLRPRVVAAAIRTFATARLAVSLRVAAE
jgi:hypothetical protein